MCARPSPLRGTNHDVNRNDNFYIAESYMCAPASFAFASSSHVVHEHPCRSHVVGVAFMSLMNMPQLLGQKEMEVTCHGYMTW